MPFLGCRLSGALAWRAAQLFPRETGANQETGLTGVSLLRDAGRAQSLDLSPVVKSEIHIRETVKLKPKAYNGLKHTQLHSLRTVTVNCHVIARLHTEEPLCYARTYTEEPSCYIPELIRRSHCAINAVTRQALMYRCVSLWNMDEGLVERPPPFLVLSG